MNTFVFTAYYVRELEAKDNYLRETS